MELTRRRGLISLYYVLSKLAFAIVNNSGVVQNHIRYDSFGRIVSQTVPALTPRFAYTGREWDSEIELYFYRARYYNPTAGRFIGEDPIGLTAGDGNLNRYVRNSPIQGTDPMGLLVVTPIPVPVATPWYVPLLRRVPLAIPLVIPGGILNPQPTNPYEFPHQLPNRINFPGKPIDPKDYDICQRLYEVCLRIRRGYLDCALCLRICIHSEGEWPELTCPGVLGPKRKPSPKRKPKRGNPQTCPAIS
jgi:RHS repeat-associated protein